MGKCGFVDILGAQFSGQAFFGDATAGVQDFHAAAVRKRQGQHHLGIAGGPVHGFVQELASGFGQPVQVADGVESKAVFHHLIDFAFQVPAQKEHQAFHFQPGPVPVFKGKGVQGKVFQAQAPGGCGPVPLSRLQGSGDDSPFFTQ